MSRRSRTMAVLLSSAAFAGAGTPGLAQAHGGDRDGKRGGHHGHNWKGKHHRGDRGLARTAAELGVTKEQLKTALKAVAAQQQAARRSPPSYKELVAQQLGVTTDQLKAAFQQARQSAQSHEEFKQAFAAALGKDAATVEAAFKTARDAAEGRLGGQAATRSSRRSPPSSASRSRRSTRRSTAAAASSATSSVAPPARRARRGASSPGVSPRRPRLPSLRRLRLRGGLLRLGVELGLGGLLHGGLRRCGGLRRLRRRLRLGSARGSARPRSARVGLPPRPSTPRASP